MATSCSEDNTDLPPVEERIDQAIASLRNDLTAPSQGWRLEYQPTPDAGIFFMLLDFTPDGQVTIRSDVVDNDGEFFEQTLPYRIDNALGLELIFETFGVFHHLFVQDQASFGAEFEFIFVGKEDSNLIFESKTDFTLPTRIVFEPADSGDEELFARDVAENLEAFSGLTPQIFGATPPIQQVLFNDQGVSVFWSLDPSKRNIQADFASLGTTVEEIASNNIIPLGQNTGYALRDGSLVLQTPISFNLGGQFTISEIALNDFSMDGANVCPISPDDNPRYEGVAQGLGSATLLNSQFSSTGAGFQTNNVYSVNIFFVFDGEGNSLSEEGIIAELFPDIGGFIFLYGIDPIDPDLPSFSTGLILDDGGLLVREFEPTTTAINLVEVDFTDNFFFSESQEPGTEEKLTQVLDQIFEGGDMYAFDFPQQGLTVFRLFNPCNAHEIFLVL